MSIEEAVAEVRSLPSPVLAAKRLQDLAQGYGCNENLSIMVLRFHDFHQNQNLIREMKFNTMSSKIKVSYEEIFNVVPTHFYYQCWSLVADAGAWPPKPILL